MKYTILGKKTEYEQWFTVEKATLRVETFAGNGNTMDVQRYEFKRPHVVAALVHLRDTQEIALVKQFRYSSREQTDGWILEVVAGLIEAGENAEQACVREVIEESGYRPERMVKLMSFYTSPGFSNQLTHLYVAQTLSTMKVEGAGGGLAAEGEDIETLLFSLDEAKALLSENKLVDAVTILALQNFFLSLSSTLSSS